MGQRGMYLAVSLFFISLMVLANTNSQMLDHSGMLKATDSSIDISKCKQNPEKAWEDWKEQEGRHR